MIFTKEWELSREIKRHKRKKLDKGIFRYSKKVMVSSIVFLLLVLWYLNYENYSKESLITVYGIIVGIVIIILFYSNIKLKRQIILYEQSQAVRDNRIVQQIEDKQEISRNEISNIILKNDEGYDIKTWSVGKMDSLVIGKNSRVKVDIDLSNCNYSQIISKKHAMLNKTDNGWYLEDLNSKNGTGISRLSDNRKLKVKDLPVKVQSGDTIYIGQTALLLK
jgi:hypothetical protein